MIGALVATGTLLLPARASAQFEGVITVLMHDKEEGDMTMVQWLKGNKVRADMTKASKAGDDRAGNHTMIIDHDAKTSTMVMHDQRMYMTTPLTEPKAPAAGKNRDEDRSDLTWTKTGRTETVAGVTCDVYHGTGTEDGKPTEGELCLAKGVGFMPGRVSLSGPRGPGMGELRHLPGGADAGIMKATSYENGKPHVDMEVTKVERRTVSDQDFQPPAGYQKFAMPGGPGMAPPTRP
jgi:hypothetical protein